MDKDAAPTKHVLQKTARDILAQRDAGAWGIGDLVLFAESIGREEPVEEISSDVVRDHQMVRKCYYVSKAFPPESRTFDLWWSFYHTVYSIAKAGEQGLELASRFLKLAEENRWTLDEFKKHFRDMNRDAHDSQRTFPPGQYGLIYADPAWKYENSSVEMTRAIERHYHTMDVDEIKTLADPDGRTVQDLAAKDCVLYLWVPIPLLEDGLAVMHAWDFEYKSQHVWVKDLQGMGYWVRSRHEILLIGVRGDAKPPREDVRPDSVIESPRDEHSVKPTEVYDILERCYPKIPRVELFARSGRDGWDVWGDQAPKPLEAGDVASDAGSEPEMMTDEETGDVAEADVAQKSRDKKRAKSLKADAKTKKELAKKKADKNTPRLAKGNRTKAAEHVEEPSQTPS